MARKPSRKVKESQPEPSSYWSNLSQETQSNQSRLSMVLGALIVLVIGILVFNYFNKSKETLGPAQQTQQAQQDVSPENLPGKYTVKEGDTLFLIAEKYYKDGEKFTEIAKANNLTDVNAIVVGQVIDLPKLPEDVALAPTVTPAPTPSPEASSSPSAAPQNTGTGEADTTLWGPKITGDTYTVVEGDWLSTISARAYGDILSYNKIAQANNITNPDLIFPGQVLKLPR